MTVYNLIDTNARRIVGRALAVAERIDDVIQSIKDSGIRRKAIRELESLSDAQLDDIGIPRYAIQEFVNASFTNSADTSEKANTVRSQDRYYKPVAVTKAEFVT